MNVILFTEADQHAHLRRSGVRERRGLECLNSIPCTWYIYLYTYIASSAEISLNYWKMIRTTSLLDKNTSSLLESVKNYICYPLAIIFNCSFTPGVVPDHFKVAKGILVYKKGSPLTVSNYRPISLLSIFNKILERLMHNRRLIKYFKQ